MKIIYLQPFQEFEVENRSIGHICQRIISEEVATDMIESATEVSQGRGMDEVIASSSAAFAIEIWEKHADCTKQFSNIFVFRSLSSLRFQLSRILNEGQVSPITNSRTGLASSVISPSYPVPPLLFFPCVAV